MGDAITATVAASATVVLCTVCVAIAAMGKKSAAVTSVVGKKAAISPLAGGASGVELSRAKLREEDTTRNTWTKASSLSLIKLIKRQCLLVRPVCYPQTKGI